MAKRTNHSPTLADVARAANVSMMTASRVLNQARNVRKEKVAKVQAAIARLRYRPNELARSLITRRSSAVGMIVANLSNPFVVDVIKAVQEVARSNGYVVTVSSSGSSSEMEREEIETLVRRQIDGLLIAPSDTRRDTFGDALPPTLPAVTFDQLVVGDRFDSVTITNRASAREATEHMIGHGFRRIVAVGTRSQVYTSKERIAGYREAMNGAKFEPRVRFVNHEKLLTAEWLKREVFELHRAEAIFAMNWVSTLHVLQGLREMRMQVGKDVPLISFDDFDLGDLLSPRLSVVQQPSELLGRESARLLFERLKKSLQGPPRTIVLPAKLVIRESCGCH